MQSLPQELHQLLAKEQIRELALLYSRGVDRKNPQLLRTLYTEGATDTHGHDFDGSAEGFVDFLENAFTFMRYSGHHVCNHLISVDGDRGEGEVYALAYHILPDGEDGWIEDFLCVRYLDHYRRCEDGRWRFSKRLVTYDLHTQRPYTLTDSSEVPQDPSHGELASRLFARGPRA